MYINLYNILLSANLEYKLVTIPDIHNKTAQVYNYQTTFLTLKFDTQLFRFDFIDKKEFKLKKGTIGQFRYFEKHPLLIDYNETIVQIYINSKPTHFDNFIMDFKNAINETTKGWRDWTNYVQNKNINFTVDSFLNNVRTGTGKLFEAPISITQKAIAVCERYNVSTKTFESELIQDNFKVIFIADDYVIAKEFRLRNN